MTQAQQLKMAMNVQAYCSQHDTQNVLINACNKSISYFKTVCLHIKENYGDMALALFILDFISRP